MSADANPLLSWHGELWTSIAEARAQNRLAHALLFAGPAGVGKRQFTRRLANGLLCEAPDPAGQACGRCRSCLQFASGTHPNLFWLRPDVDDKTGKEKRDISIDQVRDLCAKLALSSHYGGAKIAVLDPADLLNHNGVNALLKTIEEPSPNTHLVLISERPMALLPTLRSRCQRLRFAIPETAMASAWLQQQEPALAADALDRAFGAPLRALEAHRSGLFQLQAQWRRDLFDIAAQKRSPIAAAGAVGRERAQAAAWLSFFIAFAAELLRARAAGEGAPDVLDIAGRISIAGLQQMFDEAFESSRRLQTSAQPQAVIESLMIAWWRWSLSRPSPAPARAGA